jgi:CHASE3 domain sensor protein
MRQCAKEIGQMQKIESAACEQRDGQPHEHAIKSTARKVSAGFAVALACLAVVSVASWLSITQMKEDARRVEHTHEVLECLDTLLSTVLAAETAERGLVVTDDRDYLERYRRAVQAADAIQRRLSELTVDNATQQGRLHDLEAVTAERVRQFETVLRLRQAEGFVGAQREIQKGLGKRAQTAINSQIGQMQNAERALLRERERRAEHSTGVTQSIMWGGGGLAFAFVGVAGLAIRRSSACRLLEQRRRAI